ncbi:MAG: hypothetical protein EPO28_13580 [Saprospiraceae bacterium]|nr:MAG: hypothetical protein EPO28_13580 [Saprospiraceae bacterium]
MKYLVQFLPVLALAVLCAGWLALQFLAKKMGTKNHFENGSSSCGGNCGCGASCTKEKQGID